MISPSSLRRSRKESNESEEKITLLIEKSHNLNWWERFVVNVIKSGSIPRHVAFIMDGNRRFARTKNLKSVTIENFKRSQEEVDAIFDLVYDRFREHWDERHEAIKYGLKIRIIGDRSMMPLKFRKLCSKLELFTKDCRNRTINLAIAYTWRAEMTASLNLLREHEVPTEIIDDKLLENSWWSSGISPIDLLIRTGSKDQLRLSDFLLWQSGRSILYFTEVTWPEFDWWNMCKAVLWYQRHVGNVERYRRKWESEESSRTDEERQTYVDKMNKLKLTELEQLTERDLGLRD